MTDTEASPAPDPDPADPTSPDPAGSVGTSAGRGWQERLPLGLFLAFVAVGAPLILFRYGAYHWFFRDDFEFLAERGGRSPAVLEPHGGAHWVALPRLLYFALWQVAGLRSYVPYQACVVALHIAVVVMVRMVMRRAGVRPWIASAAAAILVLFGPGAQNIVWAFQVSFTGSLAYGLAHLLLADHDGGFRWRDALGLVAAAAAVMSSAVGITMVVVVGSAVLVRRGWRMAALHTAPVAALYGVWTLVAEPTTSTPFGRPSPSVLFDWVKSAQIGTFLGLGHFPLVAGSMVGLLVIGIVLAVGPWRDESLVDLRRRLAAPGALFLGGFLFAATSGFGRWWVGIDGARGSRYVYLGAALTLPLLAVAAQAIARRWRPATPVLVALFLLPIPFNLDGFTPSVFGENYMEERERVLTTAVRMPFANRVPKDVQPLPDAFASDQVNMGFLLGAKRSGDLTPSSGPLSDATRNEFRVRLGVAARRVTDLPRACRTANGPLELSPNKGDVFVIPQPVNISTRSRARPTGPAVPFEGGGFGELTIELDGLRLLVTPARGARSFKLCEG